MTESCLLQTQNPERCSQCKCNTFIVHSPRLQDFWWLSCRICLQCGRLGSTWVRKISWRERWQQLLSTLAWRCRQRGAQQATVQGCKSQVLVTNTHTTGLLTPHNHPDTNHRHKPDTTQTWAEPTSLAVVKRGVLGLNTYP